MKKNLLFAAALTVTLLSGCATQAVHTLQTFQPEDLNPQVRAGRLVQKTDSFFVVNDSSSSMGNIYLGSGDYKGTKLDVEKELLNKLNKTIPAIPLSSGLLSFGFGSCLGWNSTQLNQPIQKYNPQNFSNAINSLRCSSGGTPLAEAITEIKNDIGNAPGNIALLVFSDGKGDAPAISAADTLKAKYGDRLCIYTVWVGNDPDIDGQDNLQQMADASGCGFATTANSINSAPGISDFVKKVFFKGSNFAPTFVPAKPDKDDDQDKISNAKDKCANTPSGAIVDKDGCWSFHGVLFDYDSDKIKSNFSPAIQNAVDVLKRNPSLTVEIQGHTDNHGSVAYNQNLSERRALAVKAELVKQGINPKRLTTVGFGKSQPAATNNTDGGRAYNRRVVYRRTDQ